MNYGYIRVSSDKQTVENQRFEIERFAEASSLKIDGWIEETISGTKNYDKRELGKLLKKVKKGDLIICAELSRLGRNLFMIMEILNICMSKECKVWTIKDNYRLGEDIQSKVLAFAFGLSAEIERNLISQRTKEALARKRSEGVVLGRPVGRKSSHVKLSGNEETIRTLRQRNVSKCEIAIPKYDEMYREFLLCLSDGEAHKNADIREYVFASKGLTESDRKTYISNGTQLLCNNRIGWTRTYLKKAGLIESQPHGMTRLTDEGKRVVSNLPPVVDNDFLMKYESFREFRNTSHGTTVSPVQSVSSDNLSPLDMLEKSYNELSETLADEILSEIMKTSPDFFEHLVVVLLQKMGYGGNISNSSQVVGGTGDEGIDGIIKEDKLGFDVIYIQAKRWDTNQSVSRPEVQKFVGALAGQGASKGLFITTAKFSQQAMDYAKKQHTTKVVLVDGNTLAKLMIEYDIGVSVVSTYQVKKIDSDFFDVS